jgi:hypothetical protein
MLAFIDRRSIVFRVAATLFALAHLSACVPLFFFLLMMLWKMDGGRGMPHLERTDWSMSEGEVWAWLVVGSVVFALSIVFGVLLAAGLWNAWGERPRVRAGVRFLAVFLGVMSAAYLAWVAVRTDQSERLEVLLGGAAMVAAYCTCHAAVWIAFRAT